MLKVIVACANGAGSSLMIKFKVEKILRELGVAAKVHHCAIAEAKSIVPQYDVVITALNFVKMFDFAKDKIRVIGVKNVLSEQEIKEKILESGVCNQ